MIGKANCSRSHNAAGSRLPAVLCNTIGADLMQLKLQFMWQPAT